MEFADDLEDIVNLQLTVSDLSLGETEQQQAVEFLTGLEGKTAKIDLKVKQTVSSFRKAADTLDKLWEFSKKAHAAGTTAGIVGGLFAIGAGITTIMSAGAATPLLIFGGLAFGFSGAGINVVASYMEAAMNSTEIKQAEKDWMEVSDCIKDLEKSVQKWLDMKKSAKLSTFIRDLLPLLPSLAPDVVAKFFKLAGRNGAHAAGRTGAQGAVKAGTQAVDDVAQAAAKAGAQAADDVAQAGAKAGANAGSQLLGKVIIGVSAVFLVVDAIDLGFTIKDLVENKGSEAAKFLREMADKLDKACSKMQNGIEHSGTLL